MTYIGFESHITLYSKWKEGLFSMDPITVAKWVKVIAYIVMLIAKGNSREGAVSMASTHFNIPESEIWKHGGF